MYAAGLFLLLALSLSPLVASKPLSSHHHLLRSPAKHPSSDATVYFIRHGEKPSSGNGLDPQGVERSKCLVNVFSRQSQYNIQYIMAEKPKSDGKEQRPYDTVLPLAHSLGLTIDTSCDKTDSACVQKAVDGYAGPGNILVCWEHGELTGLVAALGDKTHAPTYPDSSFNLIWTDPAPYDRITSVGSENCPGLDSGSGSGSGSGGSGSGSSSAPSPPPTASPAAAARVKAKKSKAKAKARAVKAPPVH